ncbi:MAG: hypothetical protein BAJALOKI1v1_2110004 [Promethearchaeota archaeon]|nr:MAG: hypothetical protein BAJALOKI1v1_2110004 [Candidatus Lokiarchaeota archaeon]
MNKKALALILILLFGIAGVSGAIAYFLFFRADSEPPSPLPFFFLTPSASPSYVRIYVNSSMYSEISSDITEYEQDLEEQGYIVDIVKWADSNVTNLKLNMTYYYFNYTDIRMQLFGAVLVGDMPFAYARDTSQLGPPNYPIDLYLMDLNGHWHDVNFDGYYEYGMEFLGDNFPEIFIARINPNSLNNMNNRSAFQSYFQKNRAYRNGTLNRPHSALLYIDDQWADLPGWNTDFTAYSNLTYVNDKLTTCRADYLNEYTSSYEWIHLLAHSNSTAHFFNVSGLWENVFNDDVFNNHTEALFYNLYCCDACNYTYPNNLGTQYLFSSNTLTVIGSTREGGLDLYKPFYNALRDGKVIGEAYRLWFYNSEIDLYNKRNVVSGVVVLGDPFLTIY